jgi:predicted dehydrogenase
LTCNTNPSSRPSAPATPDNARAFAAKWGFESFETDWRKLVQREDIDVIDIASPNDTHAEIAIAAAKAGKMILCEKPLSMNGPKARRWCGGRKSQSAEHGLV